MYGRISLYQAKRRKVMALSSRPYFVETVVHIENIRIRVCADENLYAVGEECIATPHNHSLYEIRYFASGSGEIVIGDKRMNIAPGELYVIHPNEYHYQDKLSIREGISQFSLRFTPIAPSEASSKAQKHAYSRLCEVLTELHHISDTELSLLPYFEKLIKEISEKRYGHVGCTTAFLTFIMTEILRRSELDDRKLGMAHTGDFMLETDSFFSREYMKKISLEDYAKQLNVSPRQASRVIRKNFGMSFTEKLTETRIEHAKVALAEGDEPISKIASACGFQSYGYFITCFRSHTGMTPAKYRATSKKN